MASRQNILDPRSRIKVQSAKLTNQSMLQDLVEHGCIDLTSLIHPSSYSELPRHGGGYGDIYKGTMRDGRDIAVKVWRCFSNVDPSLAMKRSMREIYTWSKLKQENIHELLGVTQHRGQLGMVSLWMDHGDLSTYICNNPDVNRNPWCIQVVTGVSYLHNNKTIHGDLKASNILLSRDLVAKISDFDCSLVTNSSMTFSATGELRNTLRWTAPELLNDPDEDESTIIKKTKESDIYALAMTLLEIKTGRLPYAEYRDNNRVLKALLEKRPPKRPQELGESTHEGFLWDLLVTCLSHDQTVRLDAQVVLELLQTKTKPPKVKHAFLVGHIMSTQQIFDILIQHGCNNLSSHMDPKQEHAMIVSGGGFGDIWLGKLYNGTKVAIKAWRPSAFEQNNYKSLKRASREIYIMSKLVHPNIQPLLGVILFKDQYLGMVSPWMENGNLHEYMRKHAIFDRYQTCIQITSGLAYMHHSGVVHGTLKAADVLVSAEGVAKLNDFDLAVLMADEVGIVFSESSNSRVGSLRWAAPELLLEESPIRSKPADVYALGMTMLEIFTESVPYPECRMDFAVLNTVQKGILPTRPMDRLGNDERSNKMWQLMLSCWDRDPATRPTAVELLEYLNIISSIPV